MLTPAVLDAMSERIDTAWNKGAPERRRLQPDHTYSFDEATANNRYSSIMLYSLSIFKVILLMKKLWSSKAGMLMRIPFLFDNYKTYFSHNPTDNYGKFTATTAMDTETSISSDKERPSITPITSRTPITSKTPTTSITHITPITPITSITPKHL